MTAPVKAYLETETGSRINFMFNPETLNVTRGVTWRPQPSPGQNAPSMAFSEGGSGTMILSMAYVLLGLAGLLVLFGIYLIIPRFN